MKFIKNIFNDIVGKIKKVYEIAPVTLISLLVLTIITVICYDNFNKATDYAVGFLVFLTIGSFLVESLNKEKIIGYSASAFIALVFTVLINAEDGPSFWTQMYAACYCAVAAILGVYFRYKASKKNLEEYITGMFVSIFKLSIIYGVISVGVLIIYLLVNYLLFEDADMYDILERIEILILGAYYGPSLIYSVFIPDEKIDGFFKVLIKYALNIIVLVYFVVIYLYLFKILLAWDMPSNEIFMIISVLFTLGMPIWTMAQSYTDKKKLTFLDKANNIMPYLFAPFVGLQTYSMMLRVFSYGLTPSRYLGLMLIIVEVAYIVLYAFKKTDKIFFVVVGVVVLSTIVPFVNATSLSNYTQSLVIKNYDMTRTYTNEELARIKSAYSFLSYSEGGQAYVDKYLTKEEREQLGKVDVDPDYKDIIYLYASTYGNKKRPVDVEGYSELHELSVDNYEVRGMKLDECFRSVELLSNSSEKFDIYPLVKQYIAHQDNLSDYFEENNEYEINDSAKLVLKSFELDYSYSTNTIRSFYMEGYLLRK